MNNKEKLLLLIFSTLIIGCAETIEAEGSNPKEEIKEKLKKIIPESVEITSIEETEVEGYLEVNFNGSVSYTHLTLPTIYSV